jgi:hypothetical protein
MSKTLQTRIQLKHDTAANWEIAGNMGLNQLWGESLFKVALKGEKLAMGQKL